MTTDAASDIVFTSHPARAGSSGVEHGTENPGRRIPQAKTMPRLAARWRTAVQQRRTARVASCALTGLPRRKKARKGLEVEGPAFLHVIAPCPRGWRYDPSKSIEISRLAVETCVFPLWEATDSEYNLSAPSKAIALKPERKKTSERIPENTGAL